MLQHILFVLPTAFLGGAERVTFNLAYWLAAQPSTSITIYIMSRGRQTGWELLERYPNVHFIYKDYASEKTSVLKFISEISQLSRERQFSHIFSTHTHVNALLSLLRKCGRLNTQYLIARESTVVFERFTGKLKWALYAMYRLMYGAHDLLICQTIHMQQSLLTHLQVQPAKRIIVIDNPVNLEYIHYQLNQIDIKEKPFKILIVACGRLIALKQFDCLINAFAAISHRYPEAGLMIIGAGPEKVQLEQLIIDKLLTEKIILTGHLDNPLYKFAQADIGIVCSAREGFPNVLIEMMAAGTRHVLTTPCTDSVNQLPLVSITKDTTIGAIQNMLDIALAQLQDYRNDYITYIEQHRLASVFWEKLNEHTNNVQL